MNEAARVSISTTYGHGNDVCIRVYNLVKFSSFRVRSRQLIAQQVVS